MSGKNNEDNYAVSAHRLSKSDSTPSVLAVLADGVGGHQAGEVASEIATETISNFVLNSDAANPVETLTDAFSLANQKVAEQSDTKDDRLGMGSTCSCVWIIDDAAYTVSVGDSRIYFLRGGAIQQVTTDHTWVQEAIEHGILTPEQARNHPRAHVIRRYLGSKKPVDPDFRLRLHPDESDQQAIENQGLKLLPGDQLLLCSDGLTDLVGDSEILDKIQSNEMEQAVKSLVDLANQRGGHDNITVILLKVPENKQEIKLQGQVKKPTRMQLSWQVFLAIGIFIIIAAALSTVLFIYISRIPPKATPTPSATTSAGIPELSITETGQSSPETSPEPSLEPITDLLSTNTVSIERTQIPITDTYTPWPTHTGTPEP
jgi:protein phosphatase